MTLCLKMKKVEKNFTQFSLLWYLNRENFLLLCSYLIFNKTSDSGSGYLIYLTNI